MPENLQAFPYVLVAAISLWSNIFKLAAYALLYVQTRMQKHPITAKFKLIKAVK